MDHATIERERYIDRYLLAQLSEDETARFEEHYLGCAQCLGELEAAEQLQLGLKQAAAQDIARTAATLTLWSRLARLPRQYPTLLVAALVFLLVLPAGLGWQLNQLSGELDQTRAQLDAAQAPQTGTLITYLDAERSAASPESGPSQRIRLPEEPAWIVLAAQTDQTSPVELQLLDPDGETVWSGEHRAPDALGNLTVSVHSSRLRPGDYELRFQVQGGTGKSYTFRVLAPL